MRASHSRRYFRPQSVKKMLSVDHRGSTSQTFDLVALTECFSVYFASATSPLGFRCCIAFVTPNFRSVTWVVFKVANHLHFYFDVRFVSFLRTGSFFSLNTVLLFICHPCVSAKVHFHLFTPYKTHLIVNDFEPSF